MATPYSCILDTIITRLWSLNGRADQFISLSFHAVNNYTYISSSVVWQSLMLFLYRLYIMIEEIYQGRESFEIIYYNYTFKSTYVVRSVQVCMQYM